MATATFNPPVTEVVKPATVTLELTLREAMLIDMYVAHTAFAAGSEAESISDALNKSGIEDYYDNMHLTVVQGTYSPTLYVHEGPSKATV